MGYLVGLVVSIVIASACANIANNKHRSGAAWFIAGLIFGFWALLVIALLGDPTHIKHFYNNKTTEYNRYQYEDYD